MRYSRRTTSESFRTPIQAPQANAFAERFVRTARSECLDWLLILNARHVERTLTVFIDHDNGWRPHRSLDLAPPKGGITLTMDAPRLRWHVSLMNIV